MLRMCLKCPSGFDLILCDEDVRLNILRENQLACFVEASSEEV